MASPARQEGVTARIRGACPPSQGGVGLGKWSVCTLGIAARLVAGCASGTSRGTRPASEVADVRAASGSRGTDGQFIAIESDNVEAAGYDEATRTMLGQFRDGSVYSYAPALAQRGVPYRNRR